jgi:sec-independent protein translocase protein TatA
MAPGTFTVSPGRWAGVVPEKNGGEIMIGGLGVTEILVILLIVLLLFGAKRIPDVAQGLGKGLREFKKASQDIQKDIREAGDVDKEKDSKKENKTEA